MCPEFAPCLIELDTESAGIGPNVAAFEPALGDIGISPEVAKCDLFRAMSGWL